MSGVSEPGSKGLLIRFLVKIAIYAAIILTLLTLVCGIWRVRGNDMYPVFFDGDLVLAYKLGGYSRGDVVIYEKNGVKRCGRIAATSGDEVVIMENGYYSVNGSMPYERIYYPTVPGSALTYPHTVAEGSYFILGDMRQSAVDSRELGDIEESMLKGKVRLLLLRGRGF